MNIEDTQHIQDAPRGLDTAFAKVRHFHATFGHPVAGMPMLMNLERADKRKQWMHDEIHEFMEATMMHDLTGQADAMIDLIYFAIGTLVELGIPPEELFNIVQDANMAKLHADGKPRFREDGKIIKPDNWQPPEPLLKAAIQRMVEAAAERSRQQQLPHE